MSLTAAHRRWASRVLVAFLVLGALLVAALAANAELRRVIAYRLAPIYARDSNFRRLSRGPLQVYLLGTLHGLHLDSDALSVARLQALLERLRPDLLLVEERPVEIGRGALGDGPMEMPVVVLSARSLGLRFDGIDWWQLSCGSVRRTDEARDDRMFENLFARLPARGTVLVVVGFSHVPEQAQRLQAKGFAVAPFADVEKDRLFAAGATPFRFPRGMSEAIRRRITDTETLAATSEPCLAEQLRAVTHARRDLLAEIERVGEAD